jgi:hypothetical protein
MSRRHTYGDHFIQLTVAKIYRVNVAVLSSLGPNGRLLISPSKHIEPHQDQPTSFFGHYAETDKSLKNHFVSLSWSDTSDLNTRNESVRLTSVEIMETDQIPQSAELNNLSDTELVPCSNFAGQVIQLSTTQVYADGDHIAKNYLNVLHTSLTQTSLPGYYIKTHTRLLNLYFVFSVTTSFKFDCAFVCLQLPFVNCQLNEY